MSLTASLIFDRITGLEGPYGTKDYVKALIRAAHDSNEAMAELAAYFRAEGWREPA